MLVGSTALSTATEHPERTINDDAQCGCARVQNIPGHFPGAFGHSDHTNHRHTFFREDSPTSHMPKITSPTAPHCMRRI